MSQNNKNNNIKENILDDTEYVVISSRININNENTETETQSDDDFNKLLKKDGNNIKYIDDQCPELCELAIEQNCFSIRHIKDEFRSIDLCVKAAKKSGFVLRSMSDQHPDACIAGIQSDPKSLKFVRIMENKLFDHLSHEITI